MVSNYRRTLEKDAPLGVETPCGYCRIPMGAGVTGSSGFHVDHIIPKGLAPDLINTPSNLVWACSRCNLKKGENVRGYDKRTRGNHRLFHPRKQSWRRHFVAVADGKIHGRTRAGRSTECRLAFNVEMSVLRCRAKGWADRWWPAPQGWRP